MENISLEGVTSMNIKDIAKLAGVSTSTVSKVLNKKDRDISEATRQKVLEIVQEYQYVPYSKIRKNSVKERLQHQHQLSERKPETDKAFRW